MAAMVAFRSEKTEFLPMLLDRRPAGNDPVGRKASASISRPPPVAATRGGFKNPLYDVLFPDRRTKSSVYFFLFGFLCIREWLRAKITITAFWAWSRFSASSSTREWGPSSTSLVISSPRWAGRQ